MISVLFLLLFVSTNCIDENQLKFPDKFIFGVSTASYQVEGAWMEDGKAENIWDTYTHANNSLNHADITSDFYHHYEEDIDSIKSIGAKGYSFSLSWSRILPTGHSHEINNVGVKFYNDVIDRLLANGIEPIVTLYHWDLPQKLQDLGGWTNENLVHYFMAYAQTAFRLFGDKVKKWITFSNPLAICKLGYGANELAPAINMPGISDYMCGHNLLKSHAKVYHLYKNQFANQSGTIGISIEGFWTVPMTNSSADQEASEKAREFFFNWFMNPIFGNGQYPDIMRQTIDKLSHNAGFPISRLPIFSSNDTNEIKGSSDFLGVEFFSAYAASSNVSQESPYGGNSSDLKVRIGYKDEWTSTCSSRYKVTPWALREVLRYINRTYNISNIVINANGFSDTVAYNDYNRAQYLKDHLTELLKSIHEDHINITGYYFWSLLDGYDWYDGYKCQFGLINIDFESDSRKRKPKFSFQLYRNIITSNSLNNISIPIESKSSILKTNILLSITTVLILVLYDKF